MSTPPTGSHTAPWTLPDELGWGGICATTTHIPELGVWVAVLDMAACGLDVLRDLDGLARAGVCVDALDAWDMTELSQNLPGPQRVRAALGRVLLRRMLTDRVDPTVPPEFWQLSRAGSGRLVVHGVSGRPGLVILQGPDVVVAAIAKDPVGVDIEAEPSQGIEDDLLGYSSDLLTPEERLMLAGLPPALVREDLARLWTLKRAAASALGLNVLVELGLVRARLSPPSVRVDLGLSRSPLGTSQWPVTVAGTRRWLSVVTVPSED
jgi:phosphopantetheinyl transferase